MKLYMLVLFAVLLILNLVGNLVSAGETMDVSVKIVDSEEFNNSKVSDNKEVITGQAVNLPETINDLRSFALNITPNHILYIAIILIIFLAIYLIFQKIFKRKK